jgi:signal transduction histidine kinase
LIERPADQITGKTIEGLMETDVKQQDREKVLERLHSEEQTTHSVRTDWGKKVLSVTSAAVRDPNKENIGTVMVFRDVTAEAELDRMKSAFLSMASHELRTPLNAILGYSDMMRQGALGPVSGEQEKGLERVMSNGERMLNLVNNLLDQAQIEAGQITINKHPFVIKNLVEDVVGTMRVLAEQKEIELKYSIADDVPAEINSDQQRLHQIVMNLVGNAVKFTDKGHVAIKITRPDPQHWVLEVEDTGIGMPEEAKTYIFESFRQINDPTTRKHQGSGLGLSIVKQLVTLLGGDISVESTVGKGSTFKAVLPVETPVMEKV